MKIGWQYETVGDGAILRFDNLHGAIVHIVGMTRADGQIGRCELLFHRWILHVTAIFRFIQRADRVHVAILCVFHVLAIG